MKTSKSGKSWNPDKPAAAAKAPAKSAQPHKPASPARRTAPKSK